MIKGLGLDVMLVSRMRESLKRKGFLERVFAPGEIEYLGTRADTAQSAAGLFAAKEAVLKAMGRGIGAIPLARIEIVHSDSGAPYLNMELETGTIVLSITHMGDIAAAAAVWDD